MGLPNELSDDISVNQNQIPVTVEYPSAKLGAVTRKKNQIIVLMKSSSESNKRLAQELFSELEEKITNLENAVTEQKSKIGISEENLNDLQDWFDTHFCEYTQFRSAFCSWINNVLPEDISNPLNNICYSKPEDAIQLGQSAVSFHKKKASSISSHSSEQSNSSSLRLKILERQSKLEAERRFEELKCNLERKRAEEEAAYQRELKRLGFQKEEKELELLSKRLNQYEENGSVCSGTNGKQFSRKFDDNYLGSLSNKKLGRCFESSHLSVKNEDETVKPKVSTFSNINDFATILSQQNDIALMLASNQEKSLLPKYEPIVFDGKDLIQFKDFMLAFNKTIVSKCNDDSDKYYYLIKFTAGHPNDLVKSCNGKDLSLSYKLAIELLLKHYGNEHKIADAIDKKLEMWPPIRVEDGKALHDLSIFLITCSNQISEMNILNMLNSPKVIINLVQKLPYDLRKRWRKKAHDLQVEGKMVSFKDLTDFICNEASVLNTPLYNCIQDNNPKNKNFRLQGKKSFNTSVETTENPKADNTNQVKQCLCCHKENHTIGSCIFFKKKTYQEKIDFIKKTRACYGCLAVGHSSKFCRSRAECSVCKKKHPTSLHRYDVTSVDASKTVNTTNASELKNVIEDSESSNPIDKTFNQKSFAVRDGSSAGTGNKRRVISPSVPVIIRVKGQKNYIQTYMGMDPFCSDCFIDEGLLQQLGADGKIVNITLTTMEKVKSRSSTKLLKNLEIISLDGNERTILTDVYTKKDWPFSLEDSPTPEDVSNCKELNEVPFEFIPERIGLLIGMQRLDITKPYEIIGNQDGPYASLHRFGWALNAVFDANGNSMVCHHLKIERDDELKYQIESYFSQDFIDNQPEVLCPSTEDLKWDEKIRDSLKQTQDNHYEVCLPFREENVTFPCNYMQAKQSLYGLKKRFEKNEDLYKEYNEFMQTMIVNHFVEKVPDTDIKKPNGKIYYISHHGVFHKVKKKLRVVFNCSAKYDGISLNDKLLQGPDLANNLVGVILRFRQKKVAIAGDIEKMFYQVRVCREHIDFMRFLWFPDGKLDKKPIQYRMLVHVFGAVSSPSVANYVLRNLADTGRKEVTKDVKQAILKSFYVDDWLDSFETEKEAVQVIEDIQVALQQGGFNLTGFISNSRSVLDSIPSNKLAKNIKSYDLLTEDLPQDRALGVSWNVESDSLGFELRLKETPLTRRGFLSMISSVYDPMGIAGPVLVPARRLFQESCKLHLGWDEDLPDSLLKEWKLWTQDLQLLLKYKIPRCLSKNMNGVQNSQLHIFSDGSEKAYGSCAYLRFIDEHENIVCSFVMAKSRLTPLNNTTLKTIPRIELNAANLAVKLYLVLRRELSMRIDSVFFWSDSCTVLRYINSDTQRFQRFVSNRVSFIRSHSNPEQWRYVPSGDNPADLISRGCPIKIFIDNIQWMNGPEFLQQKEENWPGNPVIQEVSDHDNEIKRSSKVMTSNLLSELTAVEKLLNASSDLYKLKCRVAGILRIRSCLLKKEQLKREQLSINELQAAEKAIWRFLQKKEFFEELEALANVNSACNSRSPLKKKSSLSKLNPFIDQDGLLRVGGRIDKCSSPYNVKHPIILPKNSQVIDLLIMSIHRSVGHLGRETVLSSLRQKYWIIGANVLVRKMLKDCIVCRKYHGRPSEQIMAELPEDRVISNEPVFSRTGVDYFGPFSVSRGRTTVKRYGVIFTCLSSRAMHLEIAHSLDTSSFISALRRFMARRGRIKKLRSDNGTNFVGAQRELKEAIANWNLKYIDNWMQQENIAWQFQTPTASHFSGVWEREIRSVRKVLNALICEQKIRLNDESLQTLACEIEAILNSRPLTNISEDPNDMEPLTPNHLLILQSGVNFPPGLFNKEDHYVKQKWKQVQYLANLFWSRWKKEYLTLLQSRQKWTHARDSLQIDDIVLVVDQQLPRGHWPMGRITEVKPDSKGFVRIAKVKISKPILGRDSKSYTTELERPVAKLILLKSVRSKI